MDLSSVVESIEILNIDKESSNLSTNTQILSNPSSTEKSCHILSDADQELLILIGFKQIVI